jgi:hypothetical protein
MKKKISLIIIIAVVFVLAGFSAYNIFINSSLESWIGDYTFSESATPNINMYYQISVYKNNNNYYAAINIDGFQTMARLLATVSGDNNSIKLIFNKYLPDNFLGSYNKGDILLSFQKNNSKLYTIWGEIQPILLSNNKSGGIYLKVMK